MADNDMNDRIRAGRQRPTPDPAPEPEAEPAEPFDYGAGPRPLAVSDQDAMRRWLVAQHNRSRLASVTVHARLRP
jgi:hypothetical protein